MRAAGAWLGLWIAMAPACVQAQTHMADGPPHAAAMDRAHAELLQRYMVALQRAITMNWMWPADEPDAACLVHIEQLPGGQVASVTVDANCPYDAAGRRSVVNAVRRAQPLPYQGYESVFRRKISLTFQPLSP